MTAPTFEALLTDPGFAQDPFPAYRLMSEQAPVLWSGAWGAWVVTGYDDVVETLRDHERFSSRGRLIELIDALPEGARAEAGPLREHFSSSGLIHTDPPDHTRMRALIKKAFSPSVIAALEARIETIVEGLLEDVDDEAGFDVVTDIAYPLPAIIIAELLGARPQDRDRFKGWSDSIVAFQGQGRAIPEAVPVSAAAITGMRSYIAELIADRRERPRDDLLGSLVSVVEEGDQLTEEEIYSTCVTFLIGGHETTTSLIANCLYRLLRDRDQLRRAADDDEALNGAIEESLRFDSPIQRTFRRVARATEYGGQELLQDHIVIQLLGAANRDPKHFEQPDSFDIERRPNRHIAFGSGVHFCIGASLARLEARTALRAILRRFPNLQLADDEVHWQSGKSLFRCVSALPVRSAGARPA